VVQGTLARADVVLQGGVRAERLRVAVLPRLESPLLGMDVLSKMRFTQNDGVLRLEAAR
jgi:aspartyl protease family protein